MIWNSAVRMFEAVAGTIVAVLLSAALWFVLKGVAFIGAGLVRLI